MKVLTTDFLRQLKNEDVNEKRTTEELKKRDQERRDI
jgi:hypothetical protein